LDNWINETWKKIEKKMSIVAPRSKNKIPYTTIDGVHDDKGQTDIGWWTNGFWAGLMWIMYKETGLDVYKEAAENSEILLDEVLKGYDALHHDVGFMWHLSAGANYRITGNKESRVRNMYAANVLAGRFNMAGGYIRAWNDWEGMPESHIGWSIIDCMMNIPLLYWASNQTNDPRFSYIAKAHADMTMRDHVRDDGSVSHIVVHDHENGGKIGEQVGQGYELGSSWSRGQAWALYGFILSYIHTQKQEYLDTAKRIAHYFIACICDDWLPKCDFRSPNEPVIYDSTAGACAACGLIVIARNVPEHERKIYMNAAVNMLKAIEEKFCNWEENEDSILQMGTELYHAKNPEKQIHLPIIYGDFFFVEAISKLKNSNDFLIW